MKDVEPFTWKTNITAKFEEEKYAQFIGQKAQSCKDIKFPQINY